MYTVGLLWGCKKDSIRSIVSSKCMKIAQQMAAIIFILYWVSPKEAKKPPKEKL